MRLHRWAHSSPVDRMDRRDVLSQSQMTRVTQSALIANLKSARSFGIVVPQSTLVRASEVIR